VPDAAPRPPPPDTPSPRGGRHWIRRLGAAAALVFLVKGLLWLAVPAFLVTQGC
jgi:hypothetical protein